MKKIKNNKKVFIIAELSANHNNNYELAVKTIESIADSGADAVKIQTYKPESLTLNLNTGHFSPRKEGLWKGYTPWNLYKKASMPFEWQPKLKKIAEDLGLIFFSSPFDFEAVEFLENIEIPIYKLASLEVTDVPLIRNIASKSKPLMISTGVAEKKDIELALQTCYDVGNKDVTLLKCTSQYPATIEDANLNTIPDMKKRFGVKVGVSDHTMGSSVPVVAVSLGATVVEKHFILDRSMGGPDAAFSMEPQEFKQMVDDVRNAEKALGQVSYEVSDKDKLRRRSLFITKDLKKGDVLTEENVRSVRPGYGMEPKELESMLGKKVNKDVEKGTPLNENLINP